MNRLTIALGRAQTIRRELWRQVDEVGVGGTLVRVMRRLAMEAARRVGPPRRNEFDDAFGTDTDGIIRPEALDIAASQSIHAVRYQTALDHVFLDLLGGLALPVEEFVFVDLGSGKGRALLLASRRPFKAIVGVELSRMLHEIANKNIAVYTTRAQPECRAIAAVCGDAAAYELPPEKLVIYLFNPFDEHVMSAVLKNIDRSFHARPRDIYIAYLKPTCRHLFDNAPFLSIERETERFVVYRTRPT